LDVILIYLTYACSIRLRNRAWSQISHKTCFHSF